MSFPSRLIGMDVSIEWKDKSNWHNYMVLAVENEFPTKWWMLLSGRRSDKGVGFSGNDFWVRLDDIETIELED